MRINSTDYYQAQQLLKQYQQNSSSSEFALDTVSSASLVNLMSDTTESTNMSSDGNDAINSSSLGLSLAQIQMDMMTNCMERMHHGNHEQMEAFKDSADAILDSGLDLSTEDKVDLLSTLQASMTDFSPQIEGLDTDMDLSSMSEDEISALFDSVQDSIEELKNNPPERQHQFQKVMEAYNETSNSFSLTGDSWLEHLSAILNNEDTYTSNDIDALLETISGEI